ncbi:MAG: Hsp20/alpha crystallin family protein [Pyrinomonadaceae bacterium]
MSIIKYDPFHELRVLQNEMNKIFDEDFAMKISHEDSTRGGWAPNVDIFENDSAIVLEAELPGMKREDFEVSIENNIVTLKGERKFESKEESDNYHRVERSYGKFTRAFNLPRTVSADNTTADFTNGVLRVTFPKEETSQIRKIKISGEDGSKDV